MTAKAGDAGMIREAMSATNAVRMIFEKVLADSGMTFFLIFFSTRVRNLFLA